MSYGCMIIERAGQLDTIQDLGRIGYQHQGMPVAGAVDPYSFQLGNLVVGNHRNKPSLEITMVGPTLRFTEPTFIAITGGELVPLLNGQPVAMWQSIPISSNDTLTLGGIKRGSRAYVSIAGGFLLPEVMNSTSTYLRGGLGGYQGRALRQGDQLHYSPITPQPGGFKAATLPYLLSPALQPSYSESITVRVIMGPDEERFTPQGVHTLLSTPYLVTTAMDRMGMRLEGEKVEHLQGADIISDAIPLGAIQIPANGQPIIMLADRQTTGGYTKIACVISVDIPKLAQARPGHTVRFQVVELDKAQQLVKKQENLFRSLEILCST